MPRLNGDAGEGEQEDDEERSEMQTESPGDEYDGPRLEGEDKQEVMLAKTNRR